MLTIPQLAILDITKVRLHEKTDPPRVDRLKKQLQKTGILKDPIIASRLNGHEDYLIVDGATRTMALKELGYKHILVQIVDYDDDDVELKTWAHCVKHLSAKSILKKIQAIKDAEIKVKPIHKADTFLQEGEITSYFILKNQPDALCITCMSGLLTQEIELLNKLTDIYSGKTEVLRILYSDVSPSLFVNHPDITAIYCTRMTKSKVKRIFAHNLPIAAGITRHLIPTRILRVNLALKFLKSHLSTIEKNKELKKLVQKLMEEKAIRYYSEPIYLFDH